MRVMPRLVYDSYGLMSCFVALAHSREAFSTPLSFCRSKPLEAENCQVRGLTETLTL